MKSQNKIKKQKKYIVGIDVGGTKIRSGLVSEEGCLISDIKTISTPSLENYPGKQPEELQVLLINEIKKIVDELQKLYSDYCINLGAISFAGLVEEYAFVTKAADLYGIWGCWDGENDIVSYRQKREQFALRDILKNLFPEMEWLVLNDIVAAAWRYRMMPEYKDLKRICVLTISTGIGYVVCDIGNQKGNDMYVVSLGHHTIDTSPEAFPCDCGGYGHLTSYASGRAAERRLLEKSITKQKQFKKSYLYKLAEEKNNNFRPDDYSKIFQKRHVSLILNNLPILLKNKIIGFFRNNSITLDGDAKDIMLASLLENKEFCLAINKNDFFSMDLFKDIGKYLAIGIKQILIKNELIDKIVIMGGFALATKKVLSKLLKSEFKKTFDTHSRLESYNTDSLIVWGMEDDADGVIGASIALMHEKEISNR